MKYFCAIVNVGKISKNSVLDDFLEQNYINTYVEI